MSHASGVLIAPALGMELPFGSDSEEEEELSALGAVHTQLVSWGIKEPGASDYASKLDQVWGGAYCGVR